MIHEHPTYRAFLADIIEQPDDDTPRLILADWLEEQGETARAEFIRVQIKLANRRRDPQFPRPTDPMELLGWKLAEHQEMAVLRSFAEDTRPCDCEMCLESRERELLSARLPDGTLLPTWWLPSAVHYVAIKGGPVIGNVMDGLRFVRGLVEEMDCTADIFLEFADDLRAATPLRKVQLTTWPGVVSFADEMLRTRFPGIEFQLPQTRVDDFLAMSFIS